MIRILRIHTEFKYLSIVGIFFLFLFSASAILASLSRSCRRPLSTGSAPRRRTSRGTVGGPPAPPAPRKFFNDQTFNQCCGSASIIMRIRIRNTAFNDRTFNVSVQRLVFAIASQGFVVEQFGIRR